MDKLVARLRHSMAAYFQPPPARFRAYNFFTRGQSSPIYAYRKPSARRRVAFASSTAAQAALRSLTPWPSDRSLHGQTMMIAIEPPPRLVSPYETGQPAGGALSRARAIVSSSWPAGAVLYLPMPPSWAEFRLQLPAFQYQMPLRASSPVAHDAEQATIARATRRPRQQLSRSGRFRRDRDRHFMPARPRRRDIIAAST